MKTPANVRKGEEYVKIGTARGSERKRTIIFSREKGSGERTGGREKV